MDHCLSDNSGRSFLIGDYIDKGSFSKVYVLQCCFTKRIFAGKFINKSKLQRYGISSKVYDEIRIHHKLNHSNIVQFFTYLDKSSHIIIVLEYCSKYSMVNILHVLKTLSAAEAKYFMKQTVAAVEYLHTHRIVHRDLKLGNLFVNKQLEIKLGDFGLAVAVEYEGQRRFSRCGTPNYLAPEVISGTGHSYEVDVWALGCILYTMLQGNPPFQGPNTSTTYNNILRCEVSISPYINPDAKCFIFNCIQKDLNSRPTVFELAKSNFLVSKEPNPKPPNIAINEDIFVSSLNTRKISNPSKSKESVQLPTNPGSNPYNLFVKLKYCLANVRNWAETDVGEFLSENVLMKPVIWVNSWMDYTNKFGFAYQLNNNNVGMVFNDNSRMLLQSEQQSLHYIADNGIATSSNTNYVPSPLVKKFKVLTCCGKYMSETLLNAHDGENLVGPNVGSVITEVFRWVKGDNAMVMFLTNGSVQVNFFTDHTKFILCGFTRTVTVIERADCMRTLKLESLQSYGCTNDLKKKLYIISIYIDKLLSV